MIEALVGEDAKKKLSNITIMLPDHPREMTPILTSVDDTFEALDQLFRLRHHLVHEAITPIGVKNDQVQKFFLHSRHFMEALSLGFICLYSGFKA